MKMLLACVKLGIQKLKREHLQVLIVHAMTHEILDLQSVSSRPACLPQLRLAGRLENLPDWIPKLENRIHPSLGGSGLTGDAVKVFQAFPNWLPFSC